MAWCDKLGLVWTFLVVVFLVVTPASYNNTATSADVVSWWVFVLGWFAILPWAFFRLVDLVTSGPARRKNRAAY